MVPESLAWPPSAWPQPTISGHTNVEQMADKRGIVRWNRGLFNNNAGASHTDKKLQEIYFEAARHQWAVQKMWKRIGHNPTHYCSMWATGSCRVCKETWWTVQNYPSETAEGAEMIDDKSPYYKHTHTNVLENENFKLYWNRSILTDKITPLIDLT